MDEFEEGKQKFLELVTSLDGTVEVVIPTTPSQSLFKISLSKGVNRTYITVHEDDILDLPEVSSVQEKTTALLQETIKALRAVKGNTGYICNGSIRLLAPYPCDKSLPSTLKKSKKICGTPVLPIDLWNMLLL